MSAIARYSARVRAAAAQRALPRRTVRLRLTLLYGGLFLVSGAVLLAITYLLVRHATGGDVLFFRAKGFRVPAAGAAAPGRLPPPPDLQTLAAQANRLRAAALAQHANELHQLLVQSGIALAAMAAISIALGWWVAGRVLAPLVTMTQRTQQISERSLHARLALTGPDDELKRLADTIDGLLGRLETAFDAQRQFVANASHELRTPLAMMRTSLDVATAKPGGVPPQVAALDAKLREGLYEAERLLEGFLDLARAEHPHGHERLPVALTPLICEVIDQRADELDTRRIRLQRSLTDADVAGSRTLLARMLANLIDNAVRHNDPGGWVHVNAERNGEIVLVSVLNGGARLDDREVAGLAQPFRRIGVERTGSSDGVGLGLSIVSAIARAHGGRLTLRARPGGGIIATVELPLIPADPGTPG